MHAIDWTLSYGTFPKRSFITFPPPPSARQANYFLTFITTSKTIHISFIDFYELFQPIFFSNSFHRWEDKQRKIFFRKIVMQRNTTQSNAAEGNFLLKARLLQKEVFQKLMFHLLKRKSLSKKILPDGAKNWSLKMLTHSSVDFCAKKNFKGFFALLVLLLRKLSLKKQCCPLSSSILPCSGNITCYAWDQYFSK